MSDFSLDDLWSEIDASFHKVERIQPGDITVSMFGEHYHISYRKIAETMEAFANEHPDKWRIVDVIAANGKKIKILRRVKVD